MSVALRRGISYPRTTRGLAGIESEAHFEQRVVKMADLYGWCGRHERNSEDARGIHTLRHGGHVCGLGWPDWVFFKEGYPPKFRELKSDLGRLGPRQQWYQAKFRACGFDVGVWRPRDWPRIVAEFAGRF